MKKNASGGGKSRYRVRPGLVRQTKPAAESERSQLLIAALLAIATLAVYGQVVTHQFITFDDDLYVWENPMVTGGLTLDGIKWAFTTFHSANWHPVTWLSHMIDCQLFGLQAGAHLFVSTLIHVANSLLIFFVLNRVTGAKWRCAIVAALFALHPLHVESVAWASERKDTLSTLFGLLCLMAYVRYVEKPSWQRYALVAGWFVLGLMAKPMLVSWPFLLLLLDYWPLRRIEWKPSDNLGRFAKRWRPLILEKIPLFLFVVPSMIVTYIAQLREEAVANLIAAPISWRLTNASVSYAKYVLLSFWPTGLSVYYPSPDQTAPAWQWIGALLLVGGITAFVIANGKMRPYLVSGWLWFLGALVPVIGFIQVGSQAMADRYTYIPSIGLFFAIVFGLADLANRWRVKPLFVVMTASISLLVFASLGAIQVSRWRNSETLFRYGLAVTSNNRVLQNNLGSTLGREGRHEEAIPHFVEALRIMPNYLDALGNMGVALVKLGRAAEAIEVYERALRIKPDSVKMHMELGQALTAAGRDADAQQEFLTAATQLGPNDFDARMNLAQSLMRQSHYADAISQLDEALRINPNSAEAHNDLGIALVMSGHTQESLNHFSIALRLKPDLEIAQQNLMRAKKELEAKQK